MVGTGILSNNMRPALPKVKRHSGGWQSTVTFTIYTNFYPVTDLELITEFDLLPNCARFPWNISNGCGMPTEKAYSSGHLVLSHFGTCMYSNVETNLSWTCLVSGLLSLEPPYFCFALLLLFFRIGRLVSLVENRSHGGIQLWCLSVYEVLSSSALVRKWCHPAVMTYLRGCHSLPW